MGKPVPQLSSLIALFLSAVVVCSTQETKLSHPAVKLDSPRQTLSITADPRWDLQARLILAPGGLLQT
jgi:hypothetical protein